MHSLPKPTHLEIRIDEWQVAQGKVDSVKVAATWRGVADNPALTGLLTALPPGTDFVPIRLMDGRTELVPAAWKHIRFGKGRPNFEAARSNFEAWAGGPADRVAQDRKHLTYMIRSFVPNFDDYTDKEQVDFIIRTQEKVSAIRDSVDALVLHLEYAAPDKGKSFPPLKNPRLYVQAAVFSDVMRSSCRAGELLGIPPTPSDADRNENQNVRKKAKWGREFLHGYFGEKGWKIKVERMREYRLWWEGFEALDDPKEQVFALLAKANGTSPGHERLLAEEEGFDKKLGDWIALVETRLEIEEIQDQNKYNDDFGWPGAIESERRRIQETDERFNKALSVFEALPSGGP
jgi:hypothetical protein